MERDLWKLMMRAMKRLPRTSPRNAVYTDNEIIAVLLWAGLHDRPIDWACRRCNWPCQAWRRRLPDQSTMSRRLRHPQTIQKLQKVMAALQDDGIEASALLLIDGKAFELSENSRDPDARTGRGVSRFSKGYKLHILIDDRRRVVAWSVRPLNEAETVVAQRLLRNVNQSSKHLLSPQAIMIGDAGYDSNKLHLRASTLKLRLIAPRRKPHRGVAKNRKHHRSRLRSIAITEGPGAKKRLKWLRVRRDDIERFFGAWVAAGTGMSHLPTWVRRQHRCELWIGAKLVINAARRAHNRRIAA